MKLASSRYRGNFLAARKKRQEKEYIATIYETKARIGALILQLPFASFRCLISLCTMLATHFQRLVYIILNDEASR